MLLLALLSTAALCALFALLPARAGRRAPSPADCKAGAGTFVFVWAAALLIYSKPSLAVGFDAFRLAAICALTVWAAGCVCWLRLGKRGVIAMAGLLLVAAAGAEALIFNAPYFATHALQPIQLFDYLAPGTPQEPDGSVLLQEGQDTLVFENIKQPLYSLQLDGLVYLHNGPYPEQADPLLNLELYFEQPGDSGAEGHWDWQAAARTPRSFARLLDLNGPVHRLTIVASSDTEYRSYRFCYLLPGITANAPRAFDFSLKRFLFVYLLLLAGWFLRPGSRAWAEEYLPNAKRWRPAVLACAAVLAVLAAAMPFADPASSCVATSFYNSANWDGVSAVSFTKHLRDGQNDYTAQYGALASRLLEGHVDLGLTPPRGLAELENPYDPSLRDDVHGVLWDAAYRNGRYYVYYGIVPCLLFQLPFEALTGIPDLPPAPCMVVLAWAVIAAAFGIGREALRRWFPHASAAVYLLTAGALVMCSQMYVLLVRPQMYEYAILTGVAFVLLALWAWLAAANTPAERRGALVARLALGSLCMALVAGCRPPMELFAVLCLPIFWQRYIREKRLLTREGAAEAAAFVLPVVLVAAGLMWYNAARFGSPFDFGANYNLTSNDMTVRGFKAGRLGPALFTFFLAPPALRTTFPFVTFFSMSTNYIGTTIREPMYGGVLAAVPFTWVLACLPVLRRRLKSKPGLTGLVWLCLGNALALAALDCEMAGVLYRYQMDFGPAVLLAAALCWLTLEEALRARQGAFPGMARVQAMCRCALAVVVPLGLLFQLLVCFDTDPDLAVQSPGLFQQVSRLVQFWL